MPKIENIIEDIRNGLPFTDGITTYRYNNKLHCAERLVTNLRGIEGKKEPFWTTYCMIIPLEDILLNDWKICKEYTNKENKK